MGLGTLTGPLSEVDDTTENTSFTPTKIYNQICWICRMFLKFPLEIIILLQLFPKLSKYSRPLPPAAAEP